MSSITVRNPAQLSDYYLGAIICRTPRTLNDTTEDGITKDNRCVVVSSARELFSYFGNPFINPAEYTDLTIAYRLASNGIPVCVSSVYDMKDNDDNFEIHYNGYTRFVFKNKEGEEIVGYELKSDIKFCQPIIQSPLACWQKKQGFRSLNRCSPACFSTPRRVSTRFLASSPRAEGTYRWH